LRQGDCIEGCSERRKKGYTRYIGYSGDREEAKYAIEMGRFRCFSNIGHIADQTPIDGNILAAEKGLGVLQTPDCNARVARFDKPENVISTSIGNGFKN
jgi:hypothetical protein